MKNPIFASILIVLFIAAACQPANQPAGTEQPPAKRVALRFQEKPVKLGDYWYKGKAELSSYELSQNRYAGLHPGEAIAIFVTEDFLTDKQVKNDHYQNPNSTPILKMNLIKHFTTGLYDYSIMQSVFTPTQTEEYPQTLKTTTSVQDWCGHVFMQLNYRDEQYQSKLYSYFEGEGDQQTAISYTVLEDELYNRIRMNPDALPTGKLKILPSAVVLRLLHLPATPQEARASLADYSGEVFNGKNLKVYTVEYPSLNRKLEIVFQGEEPYIIEGWTDTYPSVFDRQARTTTAKRKKTILSPYWQKNGLDDKKLRKELELEFL